MARIKKQQLSREHDRKGFDCGVEPLNTFLRRQARQADEKNLVRTTVLVDENQPDRILSYYATAPCEVHPPAAIRSLRTYPHRVPFLRMARLATDRTCRGQGYGEMALVAAIIDAVRIQALFTALGGLLVDAKDEGAAAFYEKYGFIRVEEDGLQLYLPINDCIAIAEEAGHQ